MNNKTWLEHLNESVNVLGFMVIIYTPLFVYLGAKDLAGQLVAGAIGLMGGKALNQAATRRSADYNGATNAKIDVPPPDSPPAV